MQFHTFQAGGYLGTRQPAKTIRPIQNKFIINEEAWDKRDLLMPTSIRELMHEQQEKSLAQDLLHRDYAPDAAPKQDINILMPTSVRG
jgi:hypothetical protein